MDDSHIDVERAFLDALRDAGFFLGDGARLIMDGEQHRCRSAEDKREEKSLKYCVYLDESPFGWLRDFRRDLYFQWSYKREMFQQWTPAEREDYIAKKKAEHEARKKLEAIRQAEAVRRARITWDAAHEALPPHSYLVRKKLTGNHGARQLGEDIILAYRDTGGEIQTIQKIFPAGGKWFQPQAPKTGHFALLDDETDPFADALEIEPTGKTWICEGWATGCSVREATGDRVIVSADAGNLLPVIENVRRAFPSWDLVVAADNDRYKKKGNTGMAKAIHILNELGIPFVAPDFGDHEQLTDWNDFAASRGTEKTREVMLYKLAAVTGTPEYRVRRASPMWLQENPKTGRPLGTKENFEILMTFMGYRVQYDEIKKETVLAIPGSQLSSDRELNAALEGTITSDCIEHGFPVTLMAGYVNWLASKNIVNPVKEWILSKKWDGASRLGKLLAAIEPADGFPTALRDILVRRWLVSGVAAAFQGDGFRARGTLVLQGAQGIGKTTFFKVLSGNEKWFAEGLTLDPSDKDSVKRCISNWIIELGELEATFRKADLAKLKSFLTNSKDELRLPWAKKHDYYQRRCIFCATVNDDQFLIDRTGNSRWWVVPVRRLHRIDDLNIQQLWAEVYQSYYLSGDADRRQWWLTSEEDMRLERQNRPFEVLNYVEELITEGLSWELPETLWCDMTPMEVLQTCGVERDRQGSFVARAGQVLKKKTGRSAERKGKDGRRTYRVPPKRPRDTLGYSRY